MQLPARFGKYQLEKFLGGGMSHVYRATDTVIGRTVAVKILTDQGCSDPESKARFLAEARTSGNIQHENIISIYDYGEEQGRPYMVMEFLVGRDLRDAIREQVLPDVPSKLKVALQVARALAHVHSKKIIHRDIKPENVHLDGTGKAKLMDFGIAKSEGLSLTKAGFALGTPYYMAPEQVLGEQVGEQSDVYSFGILVFELLTGEKPLTGDTVERLFYMILHEPVNLEPLRIVGVPEEIAYFISRCTEKKSADRYQNFTEVCAELENFLHTPESPAPPPPRVAPRQAAVTPVATPPTPVATPVPAPATAAAVPVEVDEPASNTGRNLVIGMIALVAVIAGVMIWYMRDRSIATANLPELIETETGIMHLVPGGRFLEGKDKRQSLVPGFYMDRTEVSNEHYARFCAEQNRPLPPDFPKDKPDYPVVNVTITDANAFAKWAGKRLPDALEWEKAARGLEGRLFPWGDTQDAERANVANSSHGGKLMPVDSLHQGASPFKILHMAGNALEYVRNEITPSVEAVERFAAIVQPPPAMNEPWYSVKGGSFGRPLNAAIPFEWSAVPARFAAPDIGFRCVKDVPR